MNRRLFIGQTAAGIALQYLPFSGGAIAKSNQPIAARGEPDRLLGQFATALQQGAIGKPEQIAITHCYSPEQTPLSALMALAEQDMGRLGQLLGFSIPVATQTLLADSPSAAFGSYTASLPVRSMTLTWQVMARLGDVPTDPTGTIRIYGSAGFLQLETHTGAGYMLDLQGRILPLVNTIIL